MNNFKSGSGNLDFGEEDDSPQTTGDSQAPQTEASRSESSTPVQGDTASAGASSSIEEGAATQDSSTSQDDSSIAGGSTADYPYFVRRNNVGDERDTRLEIHVRDKVAKGEAEFRSELADCLETGTVSKTDAREFALLAAFRHPERVAELMREEGFGELG